MKRKLLKLTVLLLCMMGGANAAWADNTVRYSTDGGSSWTEAADLNALNGDDKLFGTSATDVQVEVSANQTLSSRITWKVAHTLTITPTANITIKGPAGQMWFLTNVNNAVLNIGSSTYSMTLDGENKSHTSGDITRKENDSKLSLTNITYKDFNLNSACHLISCPNAGATNKLLLENITIENCTNPSTAYIFSERVVNDVLILKGALNIDANSTGTAIYTQVETKYDSDKSTYATAGRIKVDDSSAALSVTKPITFTFSEKAGGSYVPQIGSAILINSTNNFTDETAAHFSLVHEGYGTFKNNKDLKLTQAYTLDVTSAGAATLLLPFTSTIPSGANCYTLTHTSGEGIVSATPVATTLSANTPVLVEAAEGSYKFVSTATSGALAEGSSDQTFGALTGVFSEKTFGTEITSYGNIYILNKIDDNLGFYKADSGLKVGANRAYLTANSVPDAGVHGLSIVFDDNDVTAIETVNHEPLTMNQYYDLGGRRVEKPTKGLYIVNGKKVIIK